jgi:hypothetical protein
MLSLTSVPHDVRENKVNRVLFAHSGTSNFLTFLYLYSFLEPTLNSHLLNHDADHKDLCTTIAIALTMGRKNLPRDTAQRDEALEPKQKPIRLPMQLGGRRGQRTTASLRRGAARVPVHARGARSIQAQAQALPKQAACAQTGTSTESLLAIKTRNTRS